MKTTSVLIPAGILIAGGIWLALQFRSISELAEQNARMEKRLSSAGSQVATSEEITPAPTPFDSDPVDWLEVIRQLRANFHSSGLDAYPHLDEKFSAMTLDQINAFFDEVGSARLIEYDRELLENRLADEMYHKGGPRFVLDRFLPLMDTGSWKWTMGGYFKGWMDDNPDEALPWLAENVGKMKSLSFGFFETPFHSLLESSPEMAKRLLEVVPPERRTDALRSLSNRDMTEAKQIAWADVVRKLAPETIAWPIMNWSDGDGSPFTMAEVSEYMDRIDANKEERRACILTAAQAGSAGDGNVPSWKLSDADRIAQIREWTASEGPDLVDEATGFAIIGQNGVSRKNVDLALEYHASNGSDKILLPFLDQDPTYIDLQLLRELAGQLQDQTLRIKYLEKFK